MSEIVSIKKMETYLVVYLDFLGASDKMSNDADGKLLNDISALYSRISDTLSKNKVKGMSDVKMKMFSDNLVLATRYDESLDFNKFYSTKLQGLLSLTALLQVYSLDKLGLLIRGGITIGKLYIDDDFVWGPALVDGHTMESKISIYPRVIVDASLIEIISQKVSELAEHANKKYVDDVQSFICRDVDNIHYLNYHYFILKYKKALEKLIVLEVDGSTDEFISIARAASFIPSKLKSEKKSLLTLLNECPDIRAYQKISWAINYHNSFCKKVNAPSDYLIPDELCSHFPLHKKEGKKEN